MAKKKLTKKTEPIVEPTEPKVELQSTHKTSPKEPDKPPKIAKISEPEKAAPSAPKATPTTIAPKATRAEVFNQIIKSGNFTKKQISAKMKEIYGGSEAEAAFQTDTFLRLLTTMELASKKDDGTYALAK